MPDGLKAAPVVKPLSLPKKNNLYAEDAVSVQDHCDIERIVSFRIIAHVAQHQLHERCQSVYKAGYFTVTTLVKVREDILQDLD